MPADAELRDKLLSEVHVTKVAGHFGVRKTRATVSRVIGGPHGTVMLRGTSRSVTIVSKTRAARRHLLACCSLCVFATYHGSLSLYGLYYTVAPDPQSYSCYYGVCRPFDQDGPFAPTRTEALAEDVAQLFMEHVIRLHGCPKDVVSNGDTRFASRFWKAVMTLCGTKVR